jgi:hypothetical protein
MLPHKAKEKEEEKEDTKLYLNNFHVISWRGGKN